MKLYIVLPAYNEEENIEAVVKQWYPVIEQISSDSKLVIFDDGSKDSTYAKLVDLESKYPQLIGKTKINSGHGGTCLALYNYAIENNADYIFQTDSDGQTDPAEFWQFWNKRDSFDIGIGVRNAREDGSSRILVTRVLRIVIRFTFGLDLKDANTPFRLMKKEHLIEYLNLIPKDFFLSNVLISVIAKKKNEKFLWLPITFKPRQGGVNSINFKRICKIGIQAIKDFTRINKILKKSI
ncbi:glycosyltransferase family 2 protein [Dysgonomonas sp. GY617]|uniref:glycosyltransferase family 2 protein n=1 Tax=Dysgonomonas sp. GY617 TaxID=2780420 RepID=UPI001883EAD9|nr:glycosyltransferase family 2 protein [Dysgonomonas sp. GY617]MBF0574905.1 glycosyltransferase family 2 protein [Dysgonomonas sp. GY617]